MVPYCAALISVLSCPHYLSRQKSFYLPLPSSTAVCSSEHTAISFCTSMASSSFLTAFLLNFKEKSAAAFHSRKRDLNEAVSTPSVTLSTAVADGRLFCQKRGGLEELIIEARRTLRRNDRVKIHGESDLI